MWAWQVPDLTVASTLMIGLALPAIFISAYNPARIGPVVRFLIPQYIAVPAWAGRATRAKHFPVEIVEQIVVGAKLVVETGIQIVIAILDPVKVRAGG